MDTQFKHAAPNRLKQLLSTTILSLYIVQLLGSCGPVPTQDAARTLAGASARLNGATGLTLPALTVLPTETVNGVATGLTAGRLDVSLDGAATYAVPLWVPPGRAGIQPSLTLSYNSRGGNGPLGMGWAVSGFSRITRCNPSLDGAGKRLPIQFTQADDLCLDGARLVLITGTAGAVGARYRTEIDTFSQVTVIDADANGPKQFDVRTRDGQMLTYGGYGGTAEGSVLEGPQVIVSAVPPSSVFATYTGAPRVRYAWSVSKVEDRSGNFMRVLYARTETDAAVEQVPSAIEYTGSTSTVPQLQPLRRVTFHYEGRPDADVHYVSGLKLRSSQRLLKISMSAPVDSQGAVIERLREYRFTYRNDSVSKRSLLTSVEDCDGKDVCRSPLQFEWEKGLEANPDNIFEKIDTGITDVAANGDVPPSEPLENTDSLGRDFWTLQTLDINGDGRDDILYRYTGPKSNGQRPPPVWKYRLSTGLGFGPPQTANNLPRAVVGDSLDELITVDMDMDGKTDVIGLNRTNSGHPTAPCDGHYQLYRSTGSGFEAKWNNYEELYDICNDSVQDVPAPIMHVADLDGDGRPDLLRSRQPVASATVANWSYRLNTTTAAGVTFSEPNRIGGDFDRTSLVGGYATDMDGDGAVDVLLRQPASTATVDSFEQFYSAVEVSPTPCSGGPAGTSCPSATTATLAALPWDYIQRPQGPYHHLQRWFLDVNGDGLQDVVSMAKEAKIGGVRTARDLMLSLNTGAGYLPPEHLDIPLGAMPSPVQVNEGRYIDNGVRIVDFNMDGKQDLLLMDSFVDTNYPNSVGRSNVTVLESTGSGFVPRTLTNVPTGITTGSGGTVELRLRPGTGFGYRLSRLLDIDGDGLTDLVQAEPTDIPNEYRLKIYRRQGGRPDLMKAVVDSNGNRTTVGYRALTDFRFGTGLYTPGTCTYPQYCVASALPVVGTLQSPDGKGGIRSAQFSYADSRYALRGQGWLGFASRTTFDSTTQQTTTVRMDNAQPAGSLYPWARLPYLETSSIPATSSVTLSRQTTRQWELRNAPENRTKFLCPTREYSGESDSQQGQFRDVVTERDCDAYGNIVSEETFTANDAQDMNPHRHKVVVSYSNYTSNWTLGMPMSRTETDSIPADARHPSGGIASRTVRYSYCTQYDYQEEETEQCPWSNRLYKVVVEPNATGTAGADVWLATTWSRDTTGQVTSQTQRARQGIVKSFSTREYDPVERIFPVVDQTFLGEDVSTPSHRTERLYHPGLGLLAIQEDANGAREEWRYDGFGRLRRQSAPYRVGSQAAASAAHTTVSYGKEQSRTSITVKQDGGGEHVSLLDGFERLVEERERASDGSWSHATREYDALGRLWKQSFPYADREAPAFTIFTYDKAGRLSQQEASGTIKEVRTYEGRNVRQRSGWTERRLLVNARGQVVESQDFKTVGSPQSAVSTRLSYGPFGVVDFVEDAKGNLTTMSYDVLGRRTRLVTPEAGASETRYDALGAVREQTDSLGNVTTFARDFLGRPVSVQTPEGVTRFEWDTAPNGVGALAWARSGPSAVSSPTDVVLTYGYDALGRSLWETTSVDGGASTYRVDRGYDAYGRMAALIYPQVDSQLRLGMTLEYNSHNGRFSGIRNTMTGQLYWSALESNAAGQLTRELYGNGVSSLSRYDREGQLRFIESQGGQGTLQRIAYAWNTAGNLQLRNDLLANVHESFSYDALNRLTTWNVKTACDTSTTNFDYDDIGNLLKRTVSQQGADAFTEQQDYRYGEAGAGPNAMTGLGGEVFGYDASGNQLSWAAPNGDYRQVTYTSFSLPKVLESAQAGRLDFKYDAFQKRVLKLRNNGDSTLYVSGLYEKRQTAGVVSHVFQIPGAGGPVAQVQWTAASGGYNVETLYLHGDHLGSIETLSNQAGGVVQRRKYQPFGAQANPANPTQRVLPTTGSIRMGFTGHEDDAESSLVNMKGRLYDPSAGRFLSADPFVSAPFSSQGYNRYSYVFNNPLSMTDPSGFTAEGISGCYGCGGQNGAGLELPRPAMAIINWVADIVVRAGRVIAETFTGSSDVNGTVQKAEDVSDGASHAISTMASAAWEHEANRSLSNRVMWATYPHVVFYSEMYGSALDGASAGYARWGLGGAVAGAVDSQVPVFSSWTAISKAQDDWYNGNYQGLGFNGTMAAVLTFSAAGTLADGLNATKLAGVGSLRRTHSIEGGASSRKVIQMAEAIKQEGYRLPPIDVVVHEGEMFVVDGHHRLSAARMAGLLEVPVNVIEDIASHFSSWKTVEEVVQDASSVGPNGLRVKGQKVGF
ncbi:RHS repeat-associated core domain-containing protein [Corallococcus sp. RDP092CA]|uniref:RHS repeat-associated core domain-containing protein n=1 Tax=Corallococcus sp. RDP092CA TaxID=3109369 RepID=UPI0035B29D86